MRRTPFIITLALLLASLLTTACASSAPAATPVPANVEPVVIDWSIGPKGGLGEGATFITQRTWEPKKLEVPINQPFIIRFVPRDDAKDTIVFSAALKKDTGVDLPDLVVENSQPSETPVLVLKSTNRSYDVFSREHRGVGAFGTMVTPEN